MTRRFPVLHSFLNLQDVWLDDVDRAYTINLAPKKKIPVEPLIARLHQALPRVKLHSERPVYAGLCGEPGMQPGLQNMDP